VISWAGGKRWLVPRLAPRVYQRLAETGGRYIEPFLGGGAIALDLGLPQMILGDVCRPLVTMYTAIRRSPDAVLWALQDYIARGTDRERFLHVRATASHSHAVTAARFIYMNKVGFNGLHRENRKGVNNTPYGGGRRSIKFPSEADLHAVAKALRSADVQHRSALVTIALARAGDVIYADPPYDGTFTSYNAGGFSPDDQITLADALHAAHLRGAHVVASNSGTDRIYDLYRWAWVDPVTEIHRISVRANKRGATPAVLIASDEGLLG
jgi:DNA adenine methylase